MKLKKTDFSLENVYRTASRKFNPLTLCDYLAKDGGVCVVDKALALQEDCSAALFIVALHSIYGWNYEDDFKSVTAYLETDGSDIYGGVYNLQTHSVLTRRLLATTIEREERRMNAGNVSNFAPYIYSGEQLAKGLEKLTKAS